MIMKNKTPQTLCCLLAATILITGCTAPVPTVPEAASPMPSLPPAQTPTAEAPAEPAATATPGLTAQPYQSPSGAFSMSLPEGWTCSESGLYRVDCQSPQGDAALSMRTTGTGYELLQDAFFSMAQAEMVSAYRQAKEHSEEGQDVQEGQVVYRSSWREGDAYWQSTDTFLRNGAAVYHLQSAASEARAIDYQVLFDAVAASLTMDPMALSDVSLYAQRQTYTSPDLIFELDVPTGWTKYVDIISIANTVIEEFYSPDLRAKVQVVLYRKGARITQTIKAEKGLEIMRTLYRPDFKISHEKAMPDGAERLEWYAKNETVNGLTFFNSTGTSLYYYTIAWDVDTEALYKPLLDEIMASFRYTTQETSLEE
jgi:hypothetical protein